MIRHLSNVFVLLLLSVTPVLGHGGKSHVMGTVTGISDSDMAVTKQDGTSLSIHLSPTTVFRTVKGEETDARPAVGSRVVVDVTDSHDTLRATDVRFSPAAAKSAPEGHTGHHGSDTDAEASGHSHSHHGGPHATQPGVQQQ